MDSAKECFYWWPLVVVVVVDSTRVDKRSRDAGPAGESWGERASFVMRCNDIMCEEKGKICRGKKEKGRRGRV